MANGQPDRPSLPTSSGHMTSPWPSFLEESPSDRIRHHLTSVASERALTDLEKQLRDLLPPVVQEPVENVQEPNPPPAVVDKSSCLSGKPAVPRKPKSEVKPSTKRAAATTSKPRAPMKSTVPKQESKPVVTAAVRATVAPPSTPKKAQPLSSFNSSSTRPTSSTSTARTPGGNRLLQAHQSNSWEQPRPLARAGSNAWGRKRSYDELFLEPLISNDFGGGGGGARNRSMDSCGRLASFRPLLNTTSSWGDTGHTRQEMGGGHSIYSQDTQVLESQNGFLIGGRFR